MADLVTSGKTSLPAEEVITRAIQFFTDSRWRAQTQSDRSATFAGRPKVKQFEKVNLSIEAI